MSHELRLLFQRTGDNLTYRVASSSAIGEPQPFTPFLTSDDYEDLRWYLEEYMDLPMGGAEVRARRIEQSLGQWGRRLFDAVFEKGDHRVLYDALVEGEPPRLLTVATRDLDILRLPWEMMADSRGPLMRREVTIRRQLETAGTPVEFAPVKLPLRILLAVSRPDDAGFIDPRHTTRAMLEALAPLGDGVVVDFCRPATLERMEQMLSERAYHIVHFDGHGQTGALCFESDAMFGRVLTDLVPADRFGEMLAAHRIPLVILEACRSGTVGRGGTAPRLIEAGVGSVVAMSHAVHVEAAKMLLRRFYEELVKGASVGQAMEHGRAAMMEQPDRWLKRGPGETSVALQDWFLPTLYQSGEDPVLVPSPSNPERQRRDASGSQRRSPATGREPGAFPGPPMYEFVGRAWELQRLERRFLRDRAVVLHAMGGMGKTTLAREAAFWGSRTGLFPDGACFVSFEQPGGAQRAVQVLGAYFEGAAFEKRPAEEQKKRASELFQTKKVLVVWDNFESVLPAFQEGEAVMPYPPEERAAIFETLREWTADKEGAGRLLVTCRPEETGLDEVSTLELRGLAQPDALSLLHKVMQKAGVAKTYERDDLVALLKAVDMHPLSIELVGPHLAKMGPEEIVRDFESLLDKFKGEAKEHRNKSLRASLEFSLKRVSKEARKAVNWLWLFSGGVFEDNLLDVSQMEPGEWDKARGELEATALVRVESEVNVNGRPYLRFHPTLAVAAGDGAVEAEVRERYVEVYLAVNAGIRKAFFGSNPRGGMEVMAREEASFRRAVSWALEAGAYDRASAMGDTLRDYLQRAGRLRERDWWAAWLAGEVRKGGFSNAVTEREMDDAWALLSRGEPRKAMEKLEALVGRLKTTTEFDAAFTLATVCLQLGRVYYAVGWAQKAVPVLRDAVLQWEALVEKATAAGKSADDERGARGL